MNSVGICLNCVKAHKKDCNDYYCEDCKPYYIEECAKKKKGGSVKYGNWRKIPKDNRTKGQDAYCKMRVAIIDCVYCLQGAERKFDNLKDDKFKSFKPALDLMEAAFEELELASNMWSEVYDEIRQEEKKEEKKGG